MPTMTDRQSVAANTRTVNIFAGNVFEFAPSPSIVRVCAAAAAVGLNIDILIGGESVVSDSEMSNANRFPVRPDDMIAEYGANQGDRIFVALRNTTGGAIVGQTLVDVLSL